MDNQTSIEQLGNMNDQDPNVTGTVDDIINQINGDDASLDIQQEPVQGMQQQMQQMPQMQQMQQMPQNMQQMPEPVPLQAPPTEVMPPQQVTQQPIQNVDTSNLNNNIESLSKTVVTELKQPLIIIVLYCLLNIKPVDNVFKLKNIKYLVNETGELTFVSVVIKAVILALLYYLIKLFV